MAAATFLFGKGHANLLGGEVGGDTFAIDYLTDTMKIALTTSSYAYNLDTHETFADVTNEVTGTGYSAGGATLASKTIVYTAANSWATAWATGTAYAVGDIVRPTTGNLHLYRAIVAGTSHATTEPTWTLVSGQINTDNTVTWAEVGRGATQIDFADPSWTTSTIASIAYGVVYKSGGGNPLVGIMDLNGPHSVTNGTFTVQVHPLGFYVFSTP